MENNHIFRTSQYSKETNNLRANRVNLQHSSLGNNSDDICVEGNQNNNNNQDNQKKDIQVNIEFNCCKTPYFSFGKTLFFYCPNSLKHENVSDKYYTSKVNLSELPDPPFSIGPECKFIYFSFFIFKKINLLYLLLHACL